MKRRRFSCRFSVRQSQPLLLVLSGMITALPLFFESTGFLSWFSVLPYYLITKHRPHPRYRDGLLFSMGYYGSLYYWFTCLYPMTFAGFDSKESIIVIVISWFGLAFLTSLELAFVPVILRLTNCREDSRKNSVLRPLTFAAAWCLLEWGQTQTWMGVPYFRLALSQTGCRAAMYSANLFGSLFLSFLIIAVNGFLAEGLDFVFQGRRSQDGNRARHGKLLGTVALVLLTADLCYGIFGVVLYRDGDGEQVKVAAVQGNITSDEKWSSLSIASAVEHHMDLTRQAVDEGAKIIVWAETAVNISLNRNGSLLRYFSEYAEKENVTLCIGAFYKVKNGHEESCAYNGIYCFTPDGHYAAVPYCKQHLVPFGEFVPMQEVIETVLPWFAEMNLFSDTLTPGEEAVVQPSPYGKIGSLICFDSIYETAALDSVRNGAELMVIGTNDSWYRDSAAVYQHNRHAVLRAVETGRYFVRAGNTGISSVITPTGEVETASQPMTEGFVTGQVVFRTQQTLFDVIGNTFVLLCAAFLLGEILFFRICRPLFYRHQTR